MSPALNAKRARLRWLPVAIPLLVALFVGVGVYFNRVNDKPKDSGKVGALPVPPGGPERAALLKDFHQQHAGAIQAQVADRASKDPSYAKAILTVDEQFVHSLKGIDEAEKRELWNVVRRAQETVRQSAPRKN